MVDRALFFGLAGVVVAIFFVMPHIAHVDTPSMAEGWYWLAPGASVHRGDVVLACPPPRYANWAQAVGVLGIGPCGGVESVIKRVVAMAGDKVRFARTGLAVNGKRLPGTRLDIHIDDGSSCGWRAPVPHVPFGEHVLTAGEVVLLGDRRSESYDARYWGTTSRVLGRATMLWATGR